MKVKIEQAMALAGELSEHPAVPEAGRALFGLLVELVSDLAEATGAVEADAESAAATGKDQTQAGG